MNRREFIGVAVACAVIWSFVERCAAAELTAYEHSHQMQFARNASFVLFVPKTIARSTLNMLYFAHDEEE